MIADVTMLLVKCGLIIYATCLVVQFNGNEDFHMKLTVTLSALGFLGGVESSLAFVTSEPWHHILTQSSLEELARILFTGVVMGLLPILIVAWVGKDLLAIFACLDSPSPSPKSEKKFK